MNGEANNKYPISTIIPYDPDRQQLEELELEIAHKFQVLASIVKDLSYIRDNHLYPIHLTFAQYVSSRWGFNQENIDDMIKAVDVVEDVTASHIGKLLTPFNSDLICEFLNLTKLERISLANRVDSELGFAELTISLVKRCKLELYPDKCVAVDTKDTTNTTIRPAKSGI